jgi:hypothetical protein
MGTLPVDVSPVQVICKPLGWFIRDGGHTYPATMNHVAQRFGRPFAETCVNFANTWVEFTAEELQLPHEPTRRLRCWSRDCNLGATVFIDEQRVDVRWCRFNAETLPLFKRIIDASDDAWRSQNGQRPTCKAFVDLTAAEVETLRRIAAMDKAPALPSLRLISNRPKLPNLGDYTPPTRPAA